jgi:hypothetical protein
MHDIKQAHHHVFAIRPCMVVVLASACILRTRTNIRTHTPRIKPRPSLHTQPRNAHTLRKVDCDL